MESNNNSPAAAMYRYLLRANKSSIRTWNDVNATINQNTEVPKVPYDSAILIPKKMLIAKTQNKAQKTILVFLQLFIHRL